MFALLLLLFMGANIVEAKAIAPPAPTMDDVAGVYNAISVTSISVSTIGSLKYTSLLVCTISAIDSSNGNISCTQPNWQYLNTATAQIINKGKKIAWSFDGPGLIQMEKLLTDEFAIWASSKGYWLDTSSTYYDIQKMSTIPIGIVRNKKGTFPASGSITISGLVAARINSYPYTRKFSYKTKVTFKEKIG
jgi:hypothetical protein